MSAAAKSSTVRLYVTLTGLLVSVLVLLSAVVRLLATAVVSLTALIERSAARAKPRGVAPSAAAPVATQRTATVVPMSAWREPAMRVAHVAAPRVFVAPPIDRLVGARVCTVAVDRAALQAQSAKIVETLSH